ncbi:hypothetical protein ACFSYH_04115 [Populibacterium corticicola]|jgi:hypothetical protein|uniref:Uncharacterized protein n=1 Tax=Populibacterium corticicola TaxID=1812826 RepID=A0ABW5XCD9_9MICO
MLGIDTGRGSYVVACGKWTAGLDAVSKGATSSTLSQPETINALAGDHDLHEAMDYLKQLN